jgi:hypothetical protein
MNQIDVTFKKVTSMIVDFYCDNVKIASVINASVIFWPESERVLNKWGEKQYNNLANIMAPHIADMMK